MPATAANRNRRCRRRGNGSRPRVLAPRVQRCVTPPVQRDPVIARVGRLMQVPCALAGPISVATSVGMPMEKSHSAIEGAAAPELCAAMRPSRPPPPSVMRGRSILPLKWWTTRWPSRSAATAAVPVPANAVRGAPDDFVARSSWSSLILRGACAIDKTPVAGSNKQAISCQARSVSAMPVSISIIPAPVARRAKAPRSPMPSVSEPPTPAQFSTACWPAASKVGQIVAAKPTGPPGSASAGMSTHDPFAMVCSIPSCWPSRSHLTGISR